MDNVLLNALTECYNNVSARETDSFDNGRQGNFSNCKEMGT